MVSAKQLQSLDLSSVHDCEVNYLIIYNSKIIFSKLFIYFLVVFILILLKFYYYYINAFFVFLLVFNRIYYYF